jgi:hypothetical protein
MFCIPRITLETLSLCEMYNFLKWRSICYIDLPLSFPFLTVYLDVNWLAKIVIL